MKEMVFSMVLKTKKKMLKKKRNLPERKNYGAEL